MNSPVASQWIAYNRLNIYPLQEKERGIGVTAPIIRFVGLMFLGYVACIWAPTFGLFGVHPRSIWGLPGIFLSPFIHATFVHLFTNVLGVLAFGFLFAAIEGRGARSELWFIIVAQGVLTWVFARHGNHVGASGVVFGLFGYLATYGLFHRRLAPILLSGTVLFLYGGLLFGMLPLTPLVSWEAHLFGFVAGVLSAYSTKRVRG